MKDLNKILEIMRKRQLEGLGQYQYSDVYMAPELAEQLFTPEELEKMKAEGRLKEISEEEFYGEVQP